MKKRVAIACVLALLLGQLSVSAQEITPASVDAFDVPCKAAILIDQDSGTVLYEKNADQQRPIASITKVMTLLLTFEAIENGTVTLDTPVPVSEHAYGMGGSQIWLEPGEHFTLKEMLKAVCISSANDAAVAVAELIGGSEEAFVQKMNEKAQQLGMTNTHFVNACGLDAAGHLSSARDVAIMSREMLLHHPEVQNYCQVWMDSLRGGATQLVNTNKLLKSYSGITGLKTGTTGGAGVCITASATRDGLNLIAVVLGSDNGKERFDAARTLLDYGFAEYRNAQLTLPEDAPKALPVRHGTVDLVPLEYTAPEQYLMPKNGGEEPQLRLELPEELEAGVEKGQQIGTLQVLRGEAVLENCPITAGETVEKMNFLFCFRRFTEALLFGA